MKKSDATEYLRKRDIWVRYVLGANLPMATRVVGAHLGMRMNGYTQYAWPNLKTVAKDLCISTRHAQRGMLELEKIGLIKVVRHEGKGNAYYLKLPSDP